MSELELLRATVRAKHVYWDALRALEKAIAPGEEFSDAANNEVIDCIDCLAAGSDDVDTVTEEHLNRIQELAQK